MEQRLAIDVGRGLELIDEIGELLHVEEVDLDNFFEIVGVALVVGNIVVAVIDADFLKVAGTAVVGHEEGGRRLPLGRSLRIHIILAAKAGSG